VNCLVTGCAGFIGSHLTESLLEDEHDVIGVDCFNANYGRADKLRNLGGAQEWDGFDFVPLDLSRGDLSDLVADCDVVFHIAAEPRVRPSWGERFEAYLRNIGAKVLAEPAVQRHTEPALGPIHDLRREQILCSGSWSCPGRDPKLPRLCSAMPLILRGFCAATPAILPRFCSAICANS
jgi:NAD(P)-dependent dehydrogenase (short-subunit alcohol dehydrogenase family)